MSKLNLNFLSDERIKKLREKEISEGIDSMKGKISGMEIETKTERHVPEVPQTPARYDQEQLSELARKIYRTNIKPVEQIDEAKEKAKEVANTYAMRVNAKALAKSLVGLRNGGNEGTTTERTPNGNGDLGNFSPPADPNHGGNLGVNNAYGQYPALTTSMSLEQYEEHIAKQFFTSEPEEVEEVIEEEVFNEDAAAIAELEEALTQMEDLSWQSIDKEMRGIANDHGMTPKELHKEFKAKHGMIPDDWAKDNQVTEECGWMPLEEAVALNKIGNVYEVSMMWRGHTRRLKFFWPQVGIPSKDDMQKACEAFYPGCRLLAFYPSMDMGDNKDNYMVVVAPSVPNSIALKKEDWELMTDDESLAYEMICEEEGEPISPPMITEEGIELWIEDHDTGEERVVIINEEGLRDWFGKSKSKDGKPGWVNVVTGGTCASDKPGEGTPKCVSSAKRASMSKAERQSAARRKKAADPGQQQKSGAAKPTYVSTDKPKTKNEEFRLDEISGRLSGLAMRERGKRAKSAKRSGDMEGYKNNMEKREVNRLLHDDRVNRDTERVYADRTDYTKEEYIEEKEGKKDACYNKVKSRYKVWPSAYASGALVKCRQKGASNWGSSSKKEEFEPIEELKCWKGYKRKPGSVPGAKGSCVKEDMSGMSQKSGDKRSTESGAGMTAKGVAKYNSRTGGNLKTAVTTPPSKLKAGSKAANRRKSFCARSRGWNGERGKAARRRWNC